MAFEILGTFTASQFTRYSTWLQAQTGQVQARIQHLQAEIDRIGGLSFAYDQGGVPTHITPSDETTYIGALYQVYEALGGDPEFDLQVRSMAQPVFLTQGTENQLSQLMSNGEVVGTPGLQDANTAELIRQARDWVFDVQFYRRDLLERKIRRAMDYVDQLQAEVTLLQGIMADASTAGSLAFILAGINGLITDRTYVPAQNDANAPDPHGKMAYAPVAAYMPPPPGTDPSDAAANTIVTSYERTYDGPVVPTGDAQGTGT